MTRSLIVVRGVALVVLMFAASVLMLLSDPTIGMLFIAAIAVLCVFTLASTRTSHRRR